MQSNPLFGNSLNDLFQKVIPAENVLSTNSIDESTQKAISAEPLEDGSFKISSPEGQIHIPKEILEQMFNKMKQMRDIQDVPSKDHSPSDIFNSLTKTVMAESTEDSPPTPSPTPATPTVENFDDSNLNPNLEKPTINTKLSMKISVSNKGNDGSDDSENSPTPTRSELSDQPTESLDNHLNHLWTSTLPILVKNNKASVFTRPDIDDMSKVLPDLPTLLQKLNEVHKPGHVTIMMMNSKHMPVDKEVAKKSKILSEMGQNLLIHDIKNPHEDDAPVPVSSDDEIPPALQNFLDSLLQNLAPQDDATVPSPFIDDHHDLNDADTPWNDNEKSLVSHIIDNLHLFDKPEHLSAVSFNPRHIVQKKTPSLLHIKIKLHLPTEDSSDRSGLNSPLFNYINEPEPVYSEYQVNSDDAMNPLAALAQSLFNRPEQPHFQMKSQPKSRVTVTSYPLQRFMNAFSLPELSSPPPQPIVEAPKKRTTMFYMIMHPHPETPKPSTPALNMQTLIRDIFNIPVHRDFPNGNFGFSHSDDFDRISPAFQHVDPFASASQKTEEPFQSISEALSQFMAPNEDFPHMMSETLPAPPIQESQDISPLDILNQLQASGMNLFPENRRDVLPQENLPSEEAIPFPVRITHMKILPLARQSSDDANVFEKLFG